MSVYKIEYDVGAYVYKKRIKTKDNVALNLNPEIVYADENMNLGSIEKILENELLEKNRFPIIRKIEKIKGSVIK